MTSILLILAYLAVVSADLTFPIIDENTQCRTPTNNPGNCVNINECPPLLELVSKKPVSPQNTILLQQSTCGFDGADPKICCPTSSDTGTGNTGGNSFASHRNRRLFPSYPQCGRSSRQMQNPRDGENPRPGQYPWTVLLGYSSPTGQFNWQCGGTLISDRYVLTAAHCAQGPTARLPLVRIRVGEHVISNGGLDCEGETCIPLPQDSDITALSHPAYNRTTGVANDIALLRLRTPVTITDSVRPICLPFDRDSNNLENLNENQEVIYVTGWGAAGFPNSTTSDVLRSTRVQVVPQSTCATQYGGRVPLGPQQVCTGGLSGQGRCGADSGATLMLAEPNNRFQLIGVVSRGQDMCTGANMPVVNARVGAYLQWILDNATS